MPLVLPDWIDGGGRAAFFRLGDSIVIVHFGGPWPMAELGQYYVDLAAGRTTLLPNVQRSFYFRNLVHGGARMDALGLAADSFKVVSVYEGCLLMHELKGIPWTWDGQEQDLGGRSTWRSSTSGDADFILDM